MKLIYSLPIAFILLLLASDVPPAAADLQVNSAAESIVDPRSTNDDNNNSKSGSVDKLDNIKTNWIGGRLGKLDKTRSHSSKRLDSNGGDRKGKSVPSEKDGFQGEECGSSNKCANEKTNLVACLRVHGNESSNLSLLIQNKEPGPLRVVISAPRFVQLEQTEIQLRVNEYRKVGVSVANGNAGTISLMTQDSSCRLDFKELIEHSSRKDNNMAPKMTFAGYLTQTHSIALISIAALLMVASVWTCVSLRQKHLSINESSKYQQLDTALPVSAMALETDLGADNGWDNSWGNSWDDIEEAAMTPTMPVTPSRSSKGLASRRLDKEGWKD